MKKNHNQQELDELKNLYKYQMRLKKFKNDLYKLKKIS